MNELPNNKVVLIMHKLGNIRIVVVEIPEIIID